MPEFYHYPPPVTVVTTIGKKVTKSTSIGAPSQTHASPGAMADSAQAARIMQQTQKQLAVTTALVTSDPHTGRVIFKDLALTGGTPFPIAHGLGRAFIGWSWNRPRINAPTIFEVPATLQVPATSFLVIQSGVTCTVDVEVW